MESRKGGKEEKGGFCRAEGLLKEERAGVIFFSFSIFGRSRCLGLEFSPDVFAFQYLSISTCYRCFLLLFIIVRV